MSASAFEHVRQPIDVKALAPTELPALAASLRQEIVASVAKTGGHLASSLGAVEIAIGLARVFEPETDRIVWDVGHQSYAWKLLTGRREQFNTLRRQGGLSGFCNPEETACDAFVSGHAGSALAAAEGMAAARDLKGGTEHVVAVVGDASLSNGESLEALNNCASLKGKVILVLNDNAMSISKNVGSFARLLGRMLSGRRYNRVKAAAERAGHKMRLTFLREAYHRLEQVVKSIWLGNAFFESFGLRYIGPVDGHDVQAVENALAVARDDKRSVVVHIVTVKGRGFSPAEEDPTAWHGVGPFDAEKPERHASSPDSWSEVFGQALVQAAQKDETICALTAAMRDGTGLNAFAQAFPTRFFDSGICEEHLVTFAAGLAKQGLKPVVAIYSTFLQRAVDQVMHDVCLLNLPVVLAVDRAGCVGADGRTHHGMFDIPLLRCLPGLTVCQPRDATSLQAMLACAFEKGGPWVIRYPRGKVPQGVEATSKVDYGRAAQVCGGEAKLQLWALGEQVEKALKVAALLKERGLAAGVVDARFVKPFDAEMLAWQRAAGARIVSIENGSVCGGLGEAIGADLRFGWPDVFVEHGSVAELERIHGFDAESIARKISSVGLV
ncbi:MAG: 1-deoxy-D-xylulose-5-phosphate synthase [Kiritimatiellae bacterium]|nr:1-deoxy-D-xylulose-5-phosphate synthase [Kiritimatiellia bacterium]